MKASQSSVGRELENFLKWLIPVCDRIPKNSLALSELGRELIHAVTETIAYVRLALKTSDPNVKLELISAMNLNIEQVKVIVDTLCDYSSAPKCPRILSVKQKGAYLVFVESICRQLGGWERKTRNKIKEDQSMK